MGVDVAATIAGLDLLGKRIDGALRDIVGDAAHIFQAEGMRKAPVGVVGNSTNPPGDLARSIDVQGPDGGDGVYTARVGPTTVYGRQRELGGDIYPGFTARSIGSIDHPLGTGAEAGQPMLSFMKFGQRIYASHVYQHPEPYMKPAQEESRGQVENMMREHLTAVILSS